MLDYTQSVSAVRRALVHLNDPVYLESDGELCTLIVPAVGPSQSRGQALQTAIRVGIDRLAPDSGDECAVDAQTWEVLYQYTLARRNMAGIAMQLSMSERQGYRMLRRAVSALSDVLTRESRLSSARASGAAEVRSELERLMTEDSETVEVGTLVDEIAGAVGALAGELGVGVTVAPCDAPAYVSAQRVLLRQALLNLTSCLLGCAARDSTLTIGISREGERAILRFSYLGAAPLNDPSAQSPLAIARQILELLGIECDSTVQGRSQCTELRMVQAAGATVLLVDDNQDLVALLRRYLSGLPYRVYSASHYDDALRVVEELRPEIVILDIMLPGRDGWELMHMLQRISDERRPRIIVCSVIDDPELSASLGADAFLKKPVSQRGLVDKIHAVLTARA